MAQQRVLVNPNGRQRGTTSILDQHSRFHMAPQELTLRSHQLAARPDLRLRERRNPGNSSRRWEAGRLAACHAAQLGQESHLALLGAHPDAIRRRQQALQRRAAANLEKERAQNIEWWKAQLPSQLPSNLIAASDPDAFRKAIEGDKLVVVDFFAPWCNACRRLFPALVKMAENNPDVNFVKVNGGDTLLSKFVESLAVDKLPYFHFYKGGELISHFAANLTKISMLRAEIAAHKECVMSAIVDSLQSNLSEGEELAAE